MKVLPLEISIRVPSGKLVVANDLRYLYPEVKDNPNCSGVQWIKLITEAYGAAGLLHGYVGNSCPGVYKDGDILYLGNQPSASKNRYLYENIPGERVAGICTDLWWYSICDYGEYLKRGGDPADRRRLFIDIVKVEPGPYLLRHYWPFSDRAGSYRKGKMIYASIQRTYRLPRTWKLPEEGLKRDLLPFFHNLEYVYADENEGRTQFKVWGQMGPDHFKIYVPVEDLSDRVKIAMAIKLVKRTRERGGKTITFYAPEEYDYYYDYYLEYAHGKPPRKEKRDMPTDFHAHIPRILFDEETGKWVLEFHSEDDMGHWEVATFRYYFDSADDILAIMIYSEEEL